MGADDTVDDEDEEDNRENEQSGADTPESEELSTREKVAQQKQDAYPEVGYQHVEWDLIKPPEKRITPLSYTNRIKLSEMSPRSDSDLTQYSLYDSAGRSYVESDFDEISADTDPETVDAILQDITEDDSKAKRIALARLALIADEQPHVISDIVPTLEGQLRETAPAVKAETMGILTALAEDNAAAVEDVLPTVRVCLNTESHPDVRSEAAGLLKGIASQKPSLVLDDLPQIAHLLTDGETDASPLVAILNLVAAEYPDEVLQYVPKLESHIEDSDELSRIPALAAIGRVAKEYPDVAKEAIPIAGELLEVESDSESSNSLQKGLVGNQTHRVRANAAGVLADLADTYPSDIRPFIADIIDILDDEDEKVRHNAASVLARIAEEFPEDVAPATDDLQQLLDDDLPGTRINACWALGRGEFDEAVPMLEEVAETDPDEDVRAAANHALELMQN